MNLSKKLEKAIDIAGRIMSAVLSSASTVTKTDLFQRQ